MKKFYYISAIRSLLKISLLLAILSPIVACTNDDMVLFDKPNGKADSKGIFFTTEAPKVSAKMRVALVENSDNSYARTRTVIKHAPGQGADAYWDANDCIYVKDHDGTWHKSTAIRLNDGGASATFTLPIATYDDGCEVRYSLTGNNLLGIAETTTIQSVQTQVSSNDFSHAGVSGDCGFGVAHATGSPNEFNFVIKHTPAYLCFLPRCEHEALGQNIQLVKVTVKSNNTIAAIYDISNMANLGGSNNKISLSATGGFPLTNTSTNAETNACYMVIGPGQHDLTIAYTLKDKDTNASTDVKQTVSANFESGKIYDITGYPLPIGLFYGWDAQKDRFYGYENHQKADFTSDSGMPYPMVGDPRAENPTGDVRTDFFKTLPNINEMFWYIHKGDPHWEEPSSHVVIRGGHLVTATIGGVWLRKKSAILSYLKTQESYPATLTWDEMKEAYWDTPTDTHVDYRMWHFGLMENVKNIPHGIPANSDDYFFLPALHFYGTSAFYWSSSGATMNYAWGMSVSELGGPSIYWVQLYTQHASDVFNAYPFE